MLPVVLVGVALSYGGATSTGGLVLLLMGLIAGPVGVVMAIIGLVVLPIQIVRRNNAVARMEELKTLLGHPAAPVTGREDFGGGVVLAAF